MKTESNTGFYYHGDGLGSSLNRHGISFQSAGIDSSSEMIPMSGYFASLPTILPGNSSVTTSSPALIQPGNSSGSSLLLDSISGQKHEAGFAVEWSIDEQYILEDSLEKYKDEPSIMKYIKIAATLPDKTVRDVALRCRWMQRKRRKPEELNAGKKVNSRKGKLVESSSKVNMPSALPQNMAAYHLMMHHLDQNGRMSSEGISGTVIHLLKQNSQAFSQITSNLSAFKLQDNIDLFCHTRNNITAILNAMRDMPGLMSRMPPLPVSINDDLAISILPGATQVGYHLN
ncbi:D-alanine--D-alanine ligase [Gossypium australe]|uniref:D-alanine--D-alanine ligase n=1 Tax=Gossypium australe TaxID=47621 RepID=A0A5B6WRN8_9ROSI|nr:D-alanine--D-alanine ligase [Gossypium australe]